MGANVARNQQIVIAFLLQTKEPIGKSTRFWTMA